MGNLTSCETSAPIPPPSPAKAAIPKEEGPPALFFAGPSGVGKGTIIDKLMAANPNVFGFSVSHTSRPPRTGEVDGVNYNFSDVPTMKKMIAADKFIEHAEVHGKYYGTSFASVETVQATGKICILDIDVQGCRSCRAAGLKGKYIFLRPPSIEELERRLRGRGTEKEEAIVKRLAGAQGEIDASAEDGLFDQTITNDDLEDCFNQVNGLLAQAIAAAQKGRAAKAAAAAPSAASK